MMLAEVTSMIEKIPWFAWIPIVAVVGGVIIQLVKMQHQHAERIEMIRNGIKPDPLPPDEDHA